MIGPGPSKVNLYIKNKLEVREIWNVIAMVPSSENISLENLNEIEDEMVIMGNHRDAWVYGAADPNSGTCKQRLYLIITCIELNMYFSCFDGNR